MPLPVPGPPTVATNRFNDAGEAPTSGGITTVGGVNALTLANTSKSSVMGAMRVERA
jgi:predicted RND superfamily exporter protein